MATDTSTTSRFKASVPTLPVRDAMAAQNNYCDVLIFKPECMVNAGNYVPHFCGVSRDGVRLYLTTIEGHDHHGQCTFVIDNVDILNTDVKGKGIRITRDPQAAPRSRHFTIFDLDDSHLTIGVQ